MCICVCVCVFGLVCSKIGVFFLRWDKISVCEGREGVFHTHLSVYDPLL